MGSKDKSNNSIFSAAALVLKNSLGLGCDLVDGLVEISCVKRNAFYTAHDIVATILALAGIRSLISFNSSIDAMMSTALHITSGLPLADLSLQVKERSLQSTLSDN